MLDIAALEALERKFPKVTEPDLQGYVFYNDGDELAKFSMNLGDENPISAAELAEGFVQIRNALPEMLEMAHSKEKIEKAMLDKIAELTKERDRLLAIARTFHPGDALLIKMALRYYIEMQENGELSNKLSALLFDKDVEVADALRRLAEAARLLEAEGESEGDAEYSFVNSEAGSLL